MIAYNGPPLTTKETLLCALTPVSVIFFVVIVALGVSCGCGRCKAHKAALLAETETSMEMGMTTSTSKDVEAGINEDLKLPRVYVSPWWKRSLLRGSSTSSE